MFEPHPNPFLTYRQVTIYLLFVINFPSTCLTRVRVVFGGFLTKKSFEVCITKNYRSGLFGNVLQFWP